MPHRVAARLKQTDTLKRLAESKLSAEQGPGSLSDTEQPATVEWGWKHLSSQREAGSPPTSVPFSETNIYMKYDKKIDSW